MVNPNQYLTDTCIGVYWLIIGLKYWLNIGYYRFAFTWGFCNPSCTEQTCAWNQSTKKEVVLKGTADLFVRKRLDSSDNKNTDTQWRGKDERL